MITVDYKKLAQQRRRLLKVVPNIQNDHLIEGLIELIIAIEQEKPFPTSPHKLFCGHTVCGVLQKIPYHPATGLFCDKCDAWVAV